MSDSLPMQIWTSFPRGGAPLVLMLALGMIADENATSEASMSQLARVTRMSRSNVWRLLEELRAADWIMLNRVPGCSGAYRIRIALSKLHAAESQPATSSVSTNTFNVASCNTEEANDNVLSDVGQLKIPTSGSVPSAACAESFPIRSHRSVRQGTLLGAKIPGFARRSRQPW